MCRRSPDEGKVYPDCTGKGKLGVGAVSISSACSAALAVQERETGLGANRARRNVGGVSGSARTGGRHPTMMCRWRSTMWRDVRLAELGFLGARLHDPQLLQAGMAFAADDDMVVDRDAEFVGGFNDPGRHVYVGP